MAPKLWLERFPLVHPDHESELIAASAIHEFRGGLPREAAEAKAHQDYLKERALDAAAHHYVGVRAAHAAGNDDVAMKHGSAYAQAMKAAGHDPYEAPPPAVLDRIKDVKHKLVTFKAHPVDEILAPKPEAKPEMEKAEDLDVGVAKLRALAAQLRG